MDLRQYIGKYIDAKKILKKEYTYTPSIGESPAYITLYVHKGTGCVGDPHYVLDLSVNETGKILTLQRRLLRGNYGSKQRKLPGDLEDDIRPLMDFVLLAADKAPSSIKPLNDRCEKEKEKGLKKTKLESDQMPQMPYYKEDPQGALNYFIICMRNRCKPCFFPADLSNIYYYAKRYNQLPYNYLDDFLDVLIEYENPNLDWYQFAYTVCGFVRPLNKDHHFDRKLSRIRDKCEETWDDNLASERFFKEKLLQSLI